MQVFGDLQEAVVSPPPLTLCKTLGWGGWIVWLMRFMFDIVFELTDFVSQNMYGCLGKGILMCGGFT
jgi:hypothetical protein